MKKRILGSSGLGCNFFDTAVVYREENEDLAKLDIDETHF